MIRPQVNDSLIPLEPEPPVTPGDGPGDRYQADQQKNHVHQLQFGERSCGVLGGAISHSTVHKQGFYHK